MKKTITAFLFLFALGSPVIAQKKALIIIDIQDFYFPGGKMALVEPEKAARNAFKLAEYFRSENLPVIHVRHNSEPGGEINSIVKPAVGEKVFSKDDVNCFRGTGLEPYLRSVPADTIVICGMQTHMCVEAAVRAASDYGFRCILVHDACATRDLKYGDRIINSADVHLSTLATLRSYASIVSTEEFLLKKR